MNTKKHYLIIIVLVAILVFGIWFFQKNNVAQKEIEEKIPIRIGVMIPLSGNAVAYGDQVKKGIDIAYQGVLENSNVDIVLVYEDNKFDPKTSLTAYHKLTRIDGAKYLITFGGNICPVINPRAQEDGVVNIATGCNTLPFNEVFSYNFRFDVSEVEASRALMEFAKDELKTERLALLYVNNEWGSIVSDTVKAPLERLGIQIVAEEVFGEEDTDIRSQLTKIRVRGPDTLFFLSLANATPAVLKQIEEQGIGATLITNISIQGADPETLSKYAEGIIYSAPKLEQVEGQRNEAFYQAFPDPNSRNFASWGFDALHLLVDALEAVGDNPEKVADYLHGTHNYEGAFGGINYNQSGELELDYEIRTIKNGSFEVY